MLSGRWKITSRNFFLCLICSLGAKDVYPQNLGLIHKRLCIMVITCITRHDYINCYVSNFEILRSVNWSQFSRLKGISFAKWEFNFMYFKSLNFQMNCEEISVLIKESYNSAKWLLWKIWPDYKVDRCFIGWYEFYKQLEGCLKCNLLSWSLWKICKWNAIPM